MDRGLIGRVIGGELARAQASWREAARIVATRWDVFLHADGDTRRFAFASYVAALDAEEAAAADVLRLLKRALPSPPRDEDSCAAELRRPPARSA